MSAVQRLVVSPDTIPKITTVIVPLISETFCLRSNVIESFKITDGKPSGFFTPNYFYGRCGNTLVPEKPSKAENPTLLVLGVPKENGWETFLFLRDGDAITIENASNIEFTRSSEIIPDIKTGRVSHRMSILTSATYDFDDDQFFATRGIGMESMRILVDRVNSSIEST